MWRTVAESDLVTQLSTSLADQVGTGELPVLNKMDWVQDVLNAVLRRQQQLLFPLPCSWNVQMSDNSLSDSLCYLHTAGRAHAVHFNSPKKINTDNKHIGYFKDLFLTFLRLDGSLLRHRLYNCNQQQEDTVQPSQPGSNKSKR